MEQLISILGEIRPDVDFETADHLIDSGYLDSFDIVTLVEEINSEFGVELDLEDIVPEKFFSAETIYELIQSYK